MTLTADTISFGETEKSATTYKKDEIEGIRYGAKRVRYYIRLYVIYKIYIRFTNSKTITLKFISPFGINREKLDGQYSSIINLIYHNYLSDLQDHYMDLFENNMDFVIGDLIFTPSGLHFRKKDSIVAWEDVGTKDYRGDYCVFSLKDPNYYRVFSYEEDWNTILIFAVTRQILVNKNLLPID